MNVKKAYLGVTKTVPTIMAVMYVAVWMVTTLTWITTLVMVSGRNNINACIYIYMRRLCFFRQSNSLLALSTRLQQSCHNSVCDTYFYDDLVINYNVNLVPTVSTYIAGRGINFGKLAIFK